MTLPHPDPGSLFIVQPEYLYAVPDSPSEDGQFHLFRFDGKHFIHIDSSPNRAAVEATAAIHADPFDYTYWIGDDRLFS